ncbi:alpha/beta-hydrolase [Microthyrium microscopicum]|uniref:Alpha/beta-hydrolase n=1 Tax=Microthyrium microscopicum TaxID=703497 RepID=A0A6A6USS2_9PEZI|nr:alpha/beta-hydrolase [Microthyrium microscopicum]
MWIYALLLALFIGIGNPQFLPLFLPLENLIPSPVDPRITVQYQQPPGGTCETTFSAQKQYTGYITLPPSTLGANQNYSINSFFWFVEARESPSTAPLVVFMNGGPGSSSLIGLFQENGPCEVIQLADGTFGTQPRLWGWDRAANVIWMDQPVQTGLSFDIQTNLTHNFINDTYGSASMSKPATLPSFLFEEGTFSSQAEYATANTSTIAAQSVWHFLQAFLSTFPVYNPGVRPGSNSTRSAGIHLFTESYGGIMGPVFANYFEQQNAARMAESQILSIHLSSLGIINGLVDQKIQMPFYPRFANNNTYGIQTIDTVTLLNTLTALNSPGGCDALITRCRAAMATSGTTFGANDTVNAACLSAQNGCNTVINAYPSQLSVYDIRQMQPSPFPSNAYAEYLNLRTVQKAIGAAVNYTDSSDAVFKAFLSTGDVIRADPISDLATLLQMGVRVALIYGDADYICNWFGGEAVANALAASVPSYASVYSNTGYAEVVVNSSYVGGSVKQYGNLTFVRVYDAGHQVPAYQPETAFTIFARVLQGSSIATGESVDLANYRSAGPSHSGKTNRAPSSSSPICWVRLAATTCSQDQIGKMLSGKGTVLNGVWYEKPGDYQRPSSTVTAGKPGTPLPVTSGLVNANNKAPPPTGVYTATATPTPNMANGQTPHGNLVWVLSMILVCLVFMN